MSGIHIPTDLLTVLCLDYEDNSSISGLNHGKVSLKGVLLKFWCQS